MGFSAGSGARGEGTGLAHGTLSASGPAEAVGADSDREVSRGAGGCISPWLPGDADGAGAQIAENDGTYWRRPTGAQMTEA